MEKTDAFCGEVKETMKKAKKKIIAGAIAASGALGFSACANTPVCVYGPPPTEPAAEIVTPAPEENIQSGFDVEDNIPEDVYGPPSFWEDDSSYTVLPGTDYSPEDNIPECVYGPPEWFEK